MTAKKYLSQANFYKAMCRRLEDKIKEIREDMESVRGISYDKIRVQGGTSDSLVNYIQQLHNYEIMLQNAHLMYYKCYNQVLDVIDSLESPLHRAIVAGRYLEGFTLKVIAEKLDLSLGYIQNEHAAALKKIKVF